MNEFKVTRSNLLNVEQGQIVTRRYVGETGLQSIISQYRSLGNGEFQLLNLEPLEPHGNLSIVLHEGDMIEEFKTKTSPSGIYSRSFWATIGEEEVVVEYTSGIGFYTNQKRVVFTMNEWLSLQVYSPRSANKSRFAVSGQVFDYDKKRSIEYENEFAVDWWHKTKTEERLEAYSNRQAQ